MGCVQGNYVIIQLFQALIQYMLPRVGGKVTKVNIIVRNDVL